MKPVIVARRWSFPNLCACACTLAMLASCATFSRSSNDADGDALASAESSFAAMSSSSGMKAAFLDAMAEDAILFRPGPVNGKTFMAAQLDPAIVLEWRPQRVSVAGSGELGYSTGPWKLTSKQDADAIRFGQFFTVWRKNNAGRWQVLIDHGISHKDPIGWNAPLEKIAIDAGPLPAESIVEAEARFSLASESEGLTVAYRAFGSRYLRLLRDDEAPIDASDSKAASFDRSIASSAASLVASSSMTSSLSSSSALARWTWTSTDSGAARSSDLAWTMGRYRAIDRRGATTVGYFVRMWRAEAGSWKIISDVLATIEAPAR